MNAFALTVLLVASALFSIIKLIFSAITFLSGGMGIINPRSPSLSKSLQPPVSVLNIGTS